jgi:hypothetical protein
MMITVWLVILECKQQRQEQECILTLGDNTSAICWLYNSSCLLPGLPYYKPVQMIAHKLARIIIASSHCLASQHMRGEQNTVSNLLSYSGDIQGYAHPLAPNFPSDSILTKHFHLYIPQLIPEGFDISPLLSKISSFVIQALQTIKLSWTQSRKKPTNSGTKSGAGGFCSVLRQALILTLSLWTYSNQSPSSSFPCFSPSTMWRNRVLQTPFLASARAPWFCQLCAESLPTEPRSH